MKPAAWRLIWLFVLVVSVLFLIAPAALAGPRTVAYLDPGSGSYIFQVVVGTALGVAVSLKLMWKRTWAKLSRRSSRDPQPKDT